MLDILRLFGGDDEGEDGREPVAPKRPGRSMVDPAAWDQYWRDEFARGTAGLADMFFDDGRLIDAMRASKLNTVLCVGNGISQEPRALARAGFDVTALDLSPLAVKVASEYKPSKHHLDHLLQGRSARRKGRMRFVTGNLRDAAICPGPYDVVIERRTLQLYSDEEFPAAMRAVTDRLASPGILFSHSHRGGSGRHRFPIADWLRSEGWPLIRLDTPLAGRTAWLYSTSG